MLAEHLYRATKAALERAAQDAKDKLGKGFWKSEAEGKRLCGEIDGLNRASLILQDELGKLVKLEEDDIDP